MMVLLPADGLNLEMVNLWLHLVYTWTSKKKYLILFPINQFNQNNFLNILLIFVLNFTSFFTELSWF